MAGGRAEGKLGPGGGSWTGGVALESCPVQKSLQREERGRDKAAPWWEWVGRIPLLATFWALGGSLQDGGGHGGQAQRGEQDNLPDQQVQQARPEIHILSPRPGKVWRKRRR